MQELPSAVTFPPQGTPLSYSRLKLLPETEFPLAAQLFLGEHNFLTPGPQLLLYQELPTAVTPQRTPLSYSRPQLLPETELLSSVPFFFREHHFLTAGLQLPKQELPSAAAAPSQGRPLSHIRATAAH